jgi:hypothetical protein
MSQVALAVSPRMRAPGPGAPYPPDLAVLPEGRGVACGSAQGLSLPLAPFLFLAHEPLGGIDQSSPVPSWDPSLPVP